MESVFSSAFDLAVLFAFLSLIACHFQLLIGRVSGQVNRMPPLAALAP